MYPSITKARVLARRHVMSVPAWAVLALVGAVTRLPFVSSTPINWDAVQFALALRRFDLHAHQPHPPGYILYVFIGRVLNLPLDNPALALSLLSVLVSALALPLFYLLVLKIFEDSSVAWGAALILGASPLAIYYGAVGLTYMPEMLLSILVALLAWRTKNTKPEEITRLAVMLAVALGAAGGIRQTSLPILLPLCVWALWGVGRRVWVTFGVVFGGTCAAWLLPLVILSGGPGSYLHENALLADAVVAQTSVVDGSLGGLLYNLTFEGFGLVIGLGVGFIPIVLWAMRLVSFSLARPVRNFLLLWTLPPLLFYAVSHVGQYGYMLVLVPPLAILSAVSARVLVMMVGRRGTRQETERNGERAGLTVCGAIALFSLLYFVLAQGPTTGSNITGNEAHWRAMQSALRSYDPATTVLISGIEWDGPFREADYMLPQYRSLGVDLNRAGDLRWLYSSYEGRSDYQLPTPKGKASVQLPPGTRTVITLDNVTAGRLGTGGALDCVTLSDGSTLYVLSVSGNEQAASSSTTLLMECGEIFVGE